ncbi:ribonuclease Z [Thecamonas trahens ATCC 50062]|uniref:Ribonuclease Z n=1 Tax=Thecamonas trahens ATCC 50062 TaxID=461836 RepID=A0A0L0D8I5_THETB|nr:ribonuclease Z [Thecamonas trahens ATCC 50062]KNC48649.1 ribonuclease Z [Thecamonas trahens ATCC 50062]|eukprot:XP_013762705.1 ribonuclease Z [Thecamonas trahens ATCC 50062]
MDMVFLGTSSQPTSSRYTSATAVRLPCGSYVLFDVGEGTQRRLMAGQCAVKPSRIAAVAVTHLHGDHVFGLPGLVCAVLNAGGGPLHVYGPLGIRAFLRTSLATTYSFSRGLFVHEMRPAPPPLLAPAESSLLAEDVPPDATHTFADMYIGGSTVVRGYTPGDKNLYYAPPDEASPEALATPHWMLPLELPSAAGASGPAVTLHAAVIEHVPHVLTVGYVLEEAPRPGSLDVDKLKATPGVGRLGAWCKSLVGGVDVTLSNGTHLRSEDYVSPARPGRKIVVLGDTCDPSGIAPLATNADVLVHEASLRSADRVKAVDRGHSTTCMAGEFAASVSAGHLVLNHLSPKYIGSGDSAADTAAAAAIRAEAVAAFGSPAVTVAQDFLTVSVLPSTRSRPAPQVVVDPRPDHASTE